VIPLAKAVIVWYNKINISRGGKGSDYGRVYTHYVGNKKYAS
jgi:hypothetical protein